MSGILFVISGPSGAGKGSICAGLPLDGIAEISVSMTTRQPRPGEIEGKSYYFVSREAFHAKIEQDGFYEYAEVYGEYYGTPKAPVIERLAADKDVILEIDTQGAKQIKDTCPDGVLIFILPPSFSELRKRIERRGSESPEKIEHRLSKVQSEIAMIPRYDYCVVNQKLTTAIRDVRAIMRAEHIMRLGQLTQMIGLYDKKDMRRACALRVAENAAVIADWLAD
ncbi:MAG: guanylate kinase [Clostridiales Family XIII bacterium]|jgi:guanylate kinase|nr:guanylate kinase [Clostridiales Family XIII bacterium]